MAHVVISEQADADVTSIIAYLMREAGRFTAERYSRAFDAAYDRLAQFPKIGPPRPTSESSPHLGDIS